MLCTLLLGVLTLLAGTPAAARAQIAVSDAQASEGAGAVTFTITREAGLFAPAVTVTFATGDGSAVAPADYAATSGSRTFPSSLFGRTQVQQVSVAVAPDTLDEVNETFRLTVSGNGVAEGAATGTIVDDDPAPSIRALDAPPASEGANAVFTIALSARSGRDVSVAFATANGSAVAGQDYTARGGTLTIPAGSASVQLGVPLTDDSADEPNETFELRLSSPTAATLGDAVATATILDNDEPPAPPASPPPAVTGSPAGSPPPPATGSSSGTSTSTGTGTAPTSALPQLGVSSPRLRLPATVLVTISCPSQSGRCSGRLTIFSRPSKRSKIKALRAERRLGRGTFNLTGGASRTIRMTLSRRDRVLLRRAGRMNVRAYVVTTDGAGRTGVRRVNGTLISRTSHG